MIYVSSFALFAVAYFTVSVAASSANAIVGSAVTLSRADTAREIHFLFFISLLLYRHLLLQYAVKCRGVLAQYLFVFLVSLQFLARAIL